MPSFLSKLLRRAKAETPSKSKGLTALSSESKRASGRREPPTELDWSQAEYIPLPPSPPTWEADGRDAFRSEYSDQVLGPIFQAGFRSQNIKVLKLAVGLSPGQRQCRVGEVIAKACSKLILQRMKSGQLSAAAKYCVQMFELVPDLVNDVDRRRFNRILGLMDKEGKKHGFKPVDVSSSPSTPLFTVSAGAPWTLVGERKLQADEQPDPAFDIASLDANGVWMINRSAPDRDRPDVKSVIRRIDRSGFFISDKGLQHDVYRVGAPVAGSSIAIMDSSGVLHVYDEDLNAVTESDLRLDPRVVDHFKTINTNYWGEFKSQVRAVDAAPEGDRYIFTLADEAWCCTNLGVTVWGVVMPLKEGWRRVVGRSKRFGTSQDVEEALRLFGLSLPTDPADIKRRYRRLVQANHPDRNGGNPAATEMMKSLNRAFEILTGVDPTTLGFDDSDITYFARTGPDYAAELEGFRLEVTITGGTPQDWVYAASFSADGGAYLATHSGKVVLVSREGQPEVVYDIGTCPNEIIDAGRHTYFLTPTRLYVVESKTKLVALLDVFKQGKLLVSATGFGLLSGKRLQWFTATGEKVGELTARDPIREIHGVDGGAVVRTRQHQVQVQGLWQ